VRLVAESDCAGWSVSIAAEDRADAVSAPNAVRASELALALLERIAALGKHASATDLRLVEVEPILPSSRPSPQTIAESVSSRLISRLEGEMAGRPEGGHASQVLKDGRVAASVALPFGHIDAEDLRAFVDAATACGVAEFRLGPQRGLIALCPSDASALAVLAQARAHRLVVDAADFRVRIVACPGAPACASGHIEAREMAKQIAAALPHAIDLHISGCAKRCAAPSREGLTLLGTADGAALVIDGTAVGPGIPGDAVVPHVAKGRAEAAIRQVAALIAAERRPSETDAACARRIGHERLARTFAADAR
jgi:precorrin-3B synthase